MGPFKHTEISKPNVLKRTRPYRACLLIAMGIGIGFILDCIYCNIKSSWLRLDRSSSADKIPNYITHGVSKTYKEDVSALRALPAQRLLCIVMTSRDRIDTRAPAINATWGSRCDRTIMMSAAHNLWGMGVVHEEDPDSLWGRIKAALSYVDDNIIEDFDWVLKADDDTYVIVENLRYLLSSYDPSQPIWFGRHLTKGGVPEWYMSGSAGFALSRGAVRSFVRDGIRTPREPPPCKREAQGLEDVDLGLCLLNIGVVYGDSRDQCGRERFYPFDLQTHINPKGIAANSFLYTSYYPLRQGRAGLSDLSITFHGISPNMMHTLDYLLYHLQPYGRTPLHPPLQPPLEDMPARVYRQEVYAK